MRRGPVRVVKSGEKLEMRVAWVGVGGGGERGERG